MNRINPCHPETSCKSCETNLITALRTEYFGGGATIHRNLKKSRTPPDRKQRLIIPITVELSKLAYSSSVHNDLSRRKIAGDVRDAVTEAIDVDNSQRRFQ